MKWSIARSINFPISWELSGQFHAPVTLAPGKEPPISTEYEDLCSSVPVWTRWTREKLLPVRIGTHSLVTKPIMLFGWYISGLNIMLVHCWWHTHEVGNSFLIIRFLIAVYFKLRHLLYKPGLVVTTSENHCNMFRHSDNVWVSWFCIFHLVC